MSEHLSFRLPDGTVISSDDPRWADCAREHRAALDEIHSSAEQPRNPTDVAQGVLAEYDDPEADKRIPSRILARAVIDQAEQIEKLKAALGEALDEWRAWRNDSGKCPPGSDGRIVALRKLVTP